MGWTDGWLAVRPAHPVEEAYDGETSGVARRGEATGAA